MKRVSGFPDKNGWQLIHIDICRNHVHAISVRRQLITGWAEQGRARKGTSGKIGDIEIQIDMSRVCRLEFQVALTSSYILLKLMWQCKQNVLETRLQVYGCKLAGTTSGNNFFLSLDVTRCHLCLWVMVCQHDSLRPRNWSRREKKPSDIGAWWSHRWFWNEENMKCLPARDELKLIAAQFHAISKFPASGARKSRIG